MIETHDVGNKIRLKVLRLDKMHDGMQGNKFYKLKYNIEQAKKEDCSSLLTFGGSYSNHIHATAIAGKANGMNTIGIIRGDQQERLNHTLEFAQNMGMELHYVNREMFRNLRMASEFSIESISSILGRDIFQDTYLIPEGGTNKLALRGSAEILKEGGDFDFDVVCAPVGTGGTYAGIVSTLPEDKKALGFQVLKGSFLKNEVAEMIPDESDNWEMQDEYHFGGYAKWKPELIDFINGFKSKYNTSLCPLYTGKMMFGIMDMIKQKAFPRHTTIMAVHTGGLQGIQGFNERYGNLLN